MVADEESSSPTTELPMPEELIDPSSDDKTLAICLVQQSNKLAKIEKVTETLKIELQDLQEVLIRERFLSAKKPTLFIPLCLCFTELIKHIGLELTMPKISTLESDMLFNLLLAPIEALQDPKSKESIQTHCATILGRFADFKPFTFWISRSDRMHTLFDKLFNLMEFSGDKILAVYMSQIMSDCFFSMTPTSIDHELVEKLLVKIVELRGDEDDNDGENGGNELSEDDEDEIDEEMAHTQEMPEEKEKRLAKKRKRELSTFSERQWMLACDVIKTSAKVIEPVLNTLLSEATSAESGFLWDHFSSVIGQLVQLNGSLVRGSLALLTVRLSDERAAERFEAVDATKKVFLSDSFLNTAFHDYNALFVLFIARMKDLDPEIRLEMLSFAKEYLVRSVVAHNGSSLIYEALRERIVDRDAKVRTAAIEVISKIAESSHSALDRLDLECVQEVITRALDRLDSVRNAASSALAIIHRAAVASLLSAFEEDSATDLSSRTESNLREILSSSSPKGRHNSEFDSTTRHEAKVQLAARIKRFEDCFSSIPSKLIERVLAKDLTFEERANIDVFITENFFDNSCKAIARHKRSYTEFQDASKKAVLASTTAATPSKSTKRGAEIAQREKESKNASNASNGANNKPDPPPDASSYALHMVISVATLTESGRQGFLKWLADKKLLRDDLRNILSSHHAGGEQQLRHLFVEAVEKRYGKMGKMLFDDSVRAMFLQMLDLNSMEARVTSTAQQLYRNTKQTQAQRMTMAMVVRKLYFKTFNTGVAQSWIKQIGILTKNKENGVRKRLDETDEHMNRIYRALCGGHYPSTEEQLSTTLDILQRCAAIHPMYLVPSLDQLDELLTSTKDKRVSQAAARMSSLASSLATGKGARENRIRSLTDVIQKETDTKIVSEAGTALMSLFTTSDDPAEAQVEADEFIDERLETIRGKMSEQVAPAFAALTPLVKLLTSTKALPIVRHVTKIIRAALEAKARTSLTKEFSATPAEHVHFSTRAAVEGIQFCVSWLRTLPALANITTLGNNSSSKGARKSGAYTPLSRTPVASPFKTPKNSRAKGSSAVSPGSASRRKSLDGVVSPTRPTFKLSKDQENAVSDFAAALRDVIDDERDDLDHAWLRATAITGALRLFEFRAYDDLFDLHFYLRLSEIMMDEDLPTLVANEVKSTLTQCFTHVHRLPLKYLPFAVVFASDPIPLQPIVETRRTFIKNRTSALLGSKNSDVDDAISRLWSNYLPEFALPWLIFVLAHSPWIADDAEYKRTWEVLSTFLSAVMLSTNFDFLYQLLDDIRQVDDALEPESHNIHAVAELGLNIIGELRASDPKLQRPDMTGSSMDPKKVVLPGVLFKARFDVDEKSGEKFIRVSSSLPSYLPGDWRSPVRRTSSILQGSGAVIAADGRKAHAKKRTAAKKTRARKFNEEEEAPSPDISSETDEEMEFSSDEEGALERKRGKAKAKSKAKSSGKATSASKKTSAKNDAPAAKRTTPSRKAKSAINWDAFEEESDSETSESSGSESDSAPVVRRGKRAQPTVKPNSKSRGSNMDVDAEEESSSEDVKAPPAKRAKRGATASTSAKRTPVTSPKSKAKVTAADSGTESEDSGDEDVRLSPTARRSKRTATSPKSTPVIYSKATAKASKSGKKAVKESEESDDEESEDEVATPSTRAKRSASSAKKTTSTEASKAKPKARSAKDRLASEESSEEEMREPPAKRPKRATASSTPAKTNSKATAKKSKVSTPSSSEDESEELSTPASRLRRTPARAAATPTSTTKQAKSTSSKVLGRKK